ncbi:MAG TPA: alcohol dehydrogenase [Anaerolineales bacterium]|nr:alcohol dehydrogenase [Anaerolineales bacterium]
MKALRFEDGIPRYVLSKALGWLSPAVYWSRLGCLQYREVEEPPLLGPDWVRVQTRMAGICGSDLNTITLHDSPSLSAYASFPFTMGHENVGTIAELGLTVEGFKTGERVVVEPLLGCAVRGFDDPCPACARGDPAVCERRTEGTIAPGTFTGFCASTGGSWSPLFLAHRSQLLRVPEGMSDENGVMSEPFAVALRAVLRNPPPERGTALVLGAGTIGLCVVAALRALGYSNRTVVAARYPFQAEWARHYGANEVVRPGDDPALAEALSARLHRPILGQPLVSGGAEVVYECVGSGDNLHTAIRFTREGGTAVILGLAAISRGIDWAPIWLKEIALHGSYAYGIETYRGRRVRTMELALELMARGKVNLAPLVTHRFRLEEYRKALATATHKARHQLVKGVFVF